MHLQQPYWIITAICSEVVSHPTIKCTCYFSCVSSPFFLSFIQLDTFMEQLPCVDWHMPRMSASMLTELLLSSYHLACEVSQLLTVNWPFLLLQRILQSGEGWPGFCISADTHPAESLPFSSQTLGGQRKEDGGGGELWGRALEDKDTLVRSQKWKAGSLPVFLPAERHVLLQRMPVTTFMTQPSTSYLLLKLSSTSFITIDGWAPKRDTCVS